MSKRIILLVTISLFSLWTWLTYPTIGHLLYGFSTKAEATVYGLKSKHTAIDQHNLFYLYRGQSTQPHLTLIHGYSADSNVWLRFANQLSENYSLLIPDLPGHGQSEFLAASNYGIEAQAKRVIQLLDEQNVQNTHLIGNSMGGFIAAYMAIHYPHRVQTLTLIDSAGVISPIRSELENMVDKGNNPFLMDDVNQFPSFYAMTMAEPPFFPKPVLDAVAENYVSRKDTLSKIFDDFFYSPKIDEQLDKIVQPTLVLWGAQDKLLHVSAVEIWQNIPNSRIHIWPELGHMPMLEAPQETAKQVINLISQNSN